MTVQYYIILDAQSKKQRRSGPDARSGRLYVGTPPAHLTLVRAGTIPRYE